MKGVKDNKMDQCYSSPVRMPQMCQLRVSLHPPGLGGAQGHHTEWGQIASLFKAFI